MFCAFVWPLSVPSVARFAGVGRVDRGLVVAAVDRPPFGAVVGVEENERVVVLPDALQVGHELPDLIVEVFDHRGVDLHVAGLGLLLRSREVAPLLVHEPGAVIDVRGRAVDRVDVERLRRSVGGRRGRLREGVRRAGVRVQEERDDPERLLARDPGVSHGVVAGAVLALVAIQIRGRGLERPVRRRVCGVREERFAVAVVGVDVAEELLRIRVRVVPAGLPRLPRLHVGAIFGVVLRAGDFVEEVIARGPAEEREAVLEAPLVGSLSDRRRRAARDGRAQVPLSGHVRVVAGVLEELRHRERVRIQESLVAVEAAPFVGGRSHDALAHEVMVGARDQHRSRDGADGADVVIREDRPVGHQRVEVRGVDVAAERVNVGVPEVVGDDQKNVRRLHVPGVGRGNGRVGAGVAGGGRLDRERVRSEGQTRERGRARAGRVGRAVEAALVGAIAGGAPEREGSGRRDRRRGRRLDEERRCRSRSSRRAHGARRAGRSRGAGLPLCTGGPCRPLRAGVALRAGRACGSLRAGGPLRSLGSRLALRSRGSRGSGGAAGRAAARGDEREDDVRRGEERAFSHPAGTFHGRRLGAARP